MSFMEKNQYFRLTVEGHKKTKWICGCYETVDGFFKFCSDHNHPLKKAIKAQIDEMDMTSKIEERSS